MRGEGHARPGAADRCLAENYCIKEAKQQWDLGHPPQKTDWAVRVHVLFTLLMFALATAYRLQCEREALGEEPIGRQLLGVKLKKRPLGVGTSRKILAKYGLATDN
jgi:hypothetical protein